MSMMELLSQMRERARAKKQRKGSLPWFCIILSDKCVEPEKPCTECRVYEEHKEEIEKERRGEGADRQGSPWRQRRGRLPVHAMAARSASDDDVLDGSASERRRGEEERIW